MLDIEPRVLTNFVQACVDSVSHRWIKYYTKYLKINGIIAVSALLSIFILPGLLLKILLGILVITSLIRCLGNLARVNYALRNLGYPGLFE